MEKINKQILQVLKEILADKETITHKINTYCKEFEGKKFSMAEAEHYAMDALVSYALTNELFIETTKAYKGEIEIIIFNEFLLSFFYNMMFRGVDYDKAYSNIEADFRETTAEVKMNRKQRLLAEKSIGVNGTKICKALYSTLGEDKYKREAEALLKVQPPKRLADDDKLGQVRENITKGFFKTTKTFEAKDEIMEEEWNDMEYIIFIEALT
jgi:hypothetical protein